MKAFTLLKYAGSKRRFVDLINKEIAKTNCNIYIEPFLGSGAVFLNLEKQYERKILSDLDRNLIRIWQSFFELNSFEQLEKIYQIWQSDYGNWGRNKQLYYQFRDAMNVKYFNTNDINEGLFFYMISRSCINSLMRFGKNGFNQGFGNRGYSLEFDNVKFNLLKVKLENTELFNLDFFELINKLNLLDNKDALWFIDPPYTSTTYYHFSEYNDSKNSLLNNKEKFYEILKSIQGKVIYTDMYTEDIKNLLKWRIIDIRDLISIRPHKSAGTIRGKEVMYCNF